MEDAAANPQPIDARDAKIARLEARIAELQAIIEQLRRGGKRQAAPFSRGLPKLNPRKPGRKSGEDYGTPPAFRAMPAPAATDQVEHGIRGLCRTTKRNAANERLAAFVHRHAGRLFGYLRQPNLDATNWRGEHAMRYAVVNRKVWGGNRTERGALTQATLMSVLRTLHLRNQQPIEWLRKKLLQQNPPILA